MSLLGAIEAPIRVVQDWRSGLAGGGLYRFLAGDPPTAPDPFVKLWACPQCKRRYWSQTILQPHCLDCDAQLQYVETWDLRREVFLPVRGK